MKRVVFFLVFAFLTAASSLWAADFTLAVPAGWTKMESASLAQYQKDVASIILTADKLPSEAKTPDAYIEFVKGKLKTSFKDINFTGLKAGKQNGHETRELQYDVKMYGMTLKYLVWYEFTGDKAWTVTTANLGASTTPAYIAEIRTVFASLVCGK